MSEKTTAIATRFFDLVIKYEQWSEVETLPDHERQVLFDIVSAAGFNPKELVPGKLLGRYRDQDGDTGETYPINYFSPLKVISQEDSDHYSATGWLDCAFRVVSQPLRRSKCIKSLVEEIERSVPLTPVQLTPEGDLLREYPPSTLSFGLEYFINHTRDESKLSSCVGLHMYCGGWMNRHNATKTHDAIVCRKCHLRVLFPKEIKTYGELRQSLAPQKAKASS